MKNFIDFLSEGKSIHYFDVDDTLMKTSNANTKVHVKDEHGNRVQTLNSGEYNSHALKPGHSYDFSEFKSSENFANNAKPIRKMLAKMKAIKKNGGKTEILTARSDFDDKDKFAKKWASYGVDISPGQVHVRRAGNISLPTPQAKAKVISDAIKKDGHKEVHLYDDHKPNIDAMLALKQQHPDIAFHGHHVIHNDDDSITVKHYKA